MSMDMDEVATIVGGLILGVIVLLLCGFLGYAIVGSSANKEYVQMHAEEAATEDRLKIVAFERYRRGFLGACLYYHFERIPDNGILYRGMYQKRPYTDELHLHYFEALDAIKPVNQ